jgi:putative DNA primase/helicase
MKGRDPNQILIDEGADAVRAALDGAKPYVPEPGDKKPNGDGKARRRKANAAKLPGYLLEDQVALAFAARHADSFRYVALWGRWLRWAGDHWRPEDTLLAFDASRALCREAGDAKAKTVAAVVTLARSDRVLAAAEEQWDAHDAIFNTMEESGWRSTS